MTLSTSASARSVSPGRLAPRRPAWLLRGFLEPGTLLEPEDRLQFERRRLPAGLVLLVTPVLVLAFNGPAAWPFAALMSVAIVGYFALVAHLVRHRRDVLLGAQLALRAADVALLYVLLYTVHRVLGWTYFDSVYVLPVVAAAATHGARGTLVIAVTAVGAIAVEQTQLRSTGMVAEGPTDPALTVYYGALFLVSGWLVVALMRTSGAGVERRERALHDVIAARNRALEETAARLQTANRELEAFSYSVSHDLRAPIRAMSGFSRILAEEYSDGLDDEGRRYLGLVQQNARQMGQLVDDLLAFSRLGRLAVEIQDVDPDAIVRQVLETLEPELEGRAITVDVKPMPACRADPSLLRQVYANLLANAVKFTRDCDPALVEVGWADGAYYVRDNGVGFDMQYADKLFGVFQRLHRAEEYEGTGVGLAIVRRVVERHGGAAWAHSAPGQGATFFFTLRSDD